MKVFSRFAAFAISMVAAFALLACMAGCSASEVQKELSGLSTTLANVGKDEVSKIKDLEIADSGYTIYTKYGKKYYFATFGVCVKNPNKNYASNDVTVTVSYVSKDGAILKTVKCAVGSLGPGEKAWIGGDEGNLEQLDHLEFAPIAQMNSWVEQTKKSKKLLKLYDTEYFDLDGKKTIQFKLKKTKEYQGASVNGYFTADAAVYGVFKNKKGKIIGGAGGGLLSFEGKESAECSVWVPDKISKKTDSWKVSACPLVGK